MAKPLVANNAYSTLASTITAGSTTISVASDEGDRFPAAATGGDYFYATLIDTSNNLEVVKVTNRSSDTFTVVRAQDGTSARAFSASTRIELRPVAALFEDIRDSERTPIDASVVEAKIDDGAVTEAKINTGAVTEAKINTGAVTTAKIADEDVTVAKLEGGGSSTAGQVLVSNGDSTGTWGPAETLAATKDVTGTDGYVSLPGGLVLQWGEQSMSSDSTTSISWPTTFSNACLQAVVSQGAAMNVGSDALAAIYNLSTTGATIRNGSGNGAVLRYFAIGY